MRSDEDEIRELVAKWMKATKEGDSETVLALMADDATFIVPGQPPFGKEAFASAASSQDAASMEIDGESEVLEITVTGEWAFMLSHLTVKVKVKGSPENGSGRQHSHRPYEERWSLAFVPGRKSTGPRATIQQCHLTSYCNRKNYSL